MKLRRKRWLLTAAGVVFVYLIWLAAQTFRFKSYSQDSGGEPRRELQGIYHVHTEFSDGTRSAASAAELAGRMDIDFIILTDHGRPNTAALAAEGWTSGVLVLAGSELSVNRGHLVGLGFSPPRTGFSQNAELAAHAIQATGGFTIIAHPYSKVHWSWGVFAGYSGLEILSADAMLRRRIDRWLPYLPALAVRPNLVLLRMLRRPSRNLRKWDELNREHRVLGYFSTDAHYLYGPLFSTLRIHIPLDEPPASEFDAAKDQVLTALRSGRFYNAVEGAAEARDFRFWGESEGTLLPMGSETPLRQLDLNVRAPGSFATRILLLRDGTPLVDTREKSLIHRVERPGVYRVEVYLLEKTPLDGDTPWILSNPIFIRENRP